MQFGVFLVRRGALSPEEFVDIVERQLSERPPLGMLAIEERMLSMKQLFAVLQAQAESPEPFGRLAVGLGFMTPTEVLQLVGMQSDRCRAIAEHVVEMGMLDAEAVRDLMQQFHAKCHRQCSGEGEDDDQAVDYAAIAPRRPTAAKARKGSAAKRRTPSRSVKSRRATKATGRKG